MVPVLVLRSYQYFGSAPQWILPFKLHCPLPTHCRWIVQRSAVQRSAVQRSAAQRAALPRRFIDPKLTTKFDSASHELPVSADSALVRLEPAAVRADVVANGTVVEPFDLHRQNVRTPRSALRRYWCTI